VADCFMWSCRGWAGGSVASLIAALCTVFFTKGRKGRMLACALRELFSVDFMAPVIWSPALLCMCASLFIRPLVTLTHFSVG
jgi:hypothetical protein